MLAAEVGDPAGNNNNLVGEDAPRVKLLYSESSANDSANGAVNEKTDEREREQHDRDVIICKC